MRKLLITICLLLVCSTAQAKNFCLDANAVGCWLMSEGTGTTIEDSSANTNTCNFGASTRDPSWNTTDVPFAVSGSALNSIAFDGSNDLLECGSHATVDNISALTIVAVINADDFGVNGAIVEKIGATALGWTFGTKQTTGKLFYFAFDSDGTSREWSTNSGLSTSTQYHVAITYNNSSTSNDPIFYVNGSAVAMTETDAPNTTPSSDATKTLSIGGRSDTAYGNEAFDGKDTDVAIFSRILTAGEILKIYNHGLNGRRIF